MMKYEYGVEYETNGKKPDLPDDVLVQCRTPARDAFGNILSPNDVVWGRVAAFRIVDERRKPASDTNVGSNWHERGELPPLKSTHKEFELVGLGYYKPEFEVTAHHYNGVTVIVSIKTKDGVKLHNAKSEHFRPIQNERDVLVEDMLSHDCEPQEGMLSRRDFCAALIDAGWRPVKQQTEDEFCNQAWDECDVFKETAELLYRAGCRFVDVGE